MYVIIFEYIKIIKLNKLENMYVSVGARVCVRARARAFIIYLHLPVTTVQNDYEK